MKVRDISALERAVSVCSLQCTLEFLRFTLLLLGLSIRLLVFSLIYYDELTNTEILKQATVIIPISSAILAMYTTSRLRAEVEGHLGQIQEYAGVVPCFYDASSQYT